MQDTHWRDVGEVAAADCDILEYAAASGFVILTHDLDFGTLLAVQRSR
jgi:predicted nuclease of predicted toxin-antitoxin system